MLRLSINDTTKDTKWFKILKRVSSMGAGFKSTDTAVSSFERAGINPSTTARYIREFRSRGLMTSDRVQLTSDGRKFLERAERV